MIQNLLSAHGISKSFADRILFRDVNFGLNEKARVGLIGPNGAGKSTLLKILAGQLAPDHGTVTKRKGLRVGFLEQNPVFKKDATILETLLEKSTDAMESHAKAYEFMAKMELSQFAEDQVIEKLSGGWQKRVALARELVIEPDVLFMDEPTNHLDIAGILWLEQFLKAAPFSLLMVTHDRLFLQRVANQILDLDPRNPGYTIHVEGDYSHHLQVKESLLDAQRRHEQVQRNRLRRETEWLQRGSIARQTKQSARQKSAHDLAEDLERLEKKNRSLKVEIDFVNSAHGPKKLIQAKEVSKSFNDRILFKDLDLLLTPKSRLGLLGENGSGKSTLIRVLLGQQNPDQGQVELAEGLQVGYFEQSRETLLLSSSVLKNICPEGDYVFYQGQSVHVRSYLDRFHFSGVKAEMPASKLSGGEQARLRIAQLMLRPAQVLVLDEPTNDLDTDTLDQLEDSLKQFNGAVILVTHDRYFLDAVANQILAFPQASDDDRSLQKFANYFQWESWFESRKQAESTKTTTKVEKELSADAVRIRLSYKEKYELENMESEILLLESRLNELTLLSQSSEVLSDHKRLNQIHADLASLQEQIEKKYQRWSELDLRK